MPFLTRPLLNTVPPPPLFFTPFSITEKMVMSCFSPTTTCMMHPSPSALTSRIWLPTRTAPVGPAPLCHWDPHRPWISRKRRRTAVGEGLHSGTLFLLPLHVCVWYVMHASTHRPYTTLISRAGWTIPSLTRWTERSVFIWIISNPLI